MENDLGSLSIVSLFALGFLLGLKHAVDADHVAAVSTMAMERRSVLAASLIGVLWGLGHTISLMFAGVAVIVLRFQISSRAAQALELCVGIMLVALGINTLMKLARGGRIHMHVHEHGGRLHAHPHLHDGGSKEEIHTHHGLSFGARPLFVGIVHGLAGSAALMLVVLTAISSRLAGLAYIALFGIGSTGGMMIMSALLAMPALLTTRRFTHANGVLYCLAGLFSLSLGLFTILEYWVHRSL